MSKPVYQAIACALDAMQRCERSNNAEWYTKHRSEIARLTKEYLPSGSGLDSGTNLDLDTSKPNALKFATSFHHMNDVGMYDGWTTHMVTVRGSLLFDVEITVSGKNRNDIKEHIHSVFHAALTRRD